MSVSDEILRIRMVTEGTERVKQLQAMLAQNGAAVARLKAEFKAGSVEITEFIAKEQMLAAQASKVTREIDKQAAAMARASRHQSGKLSVNDRSVMGFGTAQIIQDVASTGNPAHGINNLLFMAQMQGGVRNLGRAYATMGKESAGWLAKMAVGHPLITAAIAATAGGLVVLNKGLKDAKLSWSDLDTVIANTKPWQVASEAIAGTAQTIGELENKGAIIGTVLAGPVGGALGAAIESNWDGIRNIVHETANLTLGWDDATEAARRHNEEVAKAAGWAQQAAEGAKEAAKIKSGEQRAAAEAGERFGQALADAGGVGQLVTGATDERRAEDRERLDALSGLAIGGNANAADQLADLFEGRGLDSRALRGAFGPGASRDTIAGPDRKVLEEGLKYSAEMDKLRAESDKAIGEARKISVEAAFGGITGLDARVDEGILGRLRSGGNLDSAMTSVADNLASELETSGGLPTEWAAEEAKRYVEERAKALKDQAASEAMDPAALRLEQLGLMGSQLGLAEMMRGPSVAPGVFDAGSFARSVQSGGADDPAKLLKEQIAIEQAGIKLQQDIKRILERGGLLGA